ncbi:hypothetical protein [Halorussus marinus]|uniref:hypothetical protein n=1 Tax=Halorussus marinus TaxID=2505976 RepID=UPI00106E87A3|nr:hypothetical protein [Halorussus marinus]
MTAIPGGIDAERGPPLVVPLGHFVVGFGFLLAGSALGVAGAAGAHWGLSGLAHVHLLLIGWVCVTIMGAMTQFVPVWSGVDLHSRRLALAQLGLVATGLAGFGAALVAGALAWLPVAGGAMLVGFWVFAYNVARSLPPVRSLDVTERHFAQTLGYAVVVTALGLALAVDFVRPTLGAAGLVRTRIVAAHATLAAFGVILTTVIGALYQLATMFTQTDLDAVDQRLRRVEEWTYPVGVIALAVGRGTDAAAVGLAGAVLVLVGVLAFSAVLARTLSRTRVERTPMLSRYGVAALALPAWALATAPAWLAAPTDPAVVFGPPGVGHFLLAGVVGFVLLGTLYHVVPFVVWLRRYSDRVGLELVPMIDDLYDDRLAAVDFWLAFGGLGLLVAGDATGIGVAGLAGGVAATLGFGLFAANLVGVVLRHGPEALRIEVLAAEAAERDPDDGLR